MPVLARARSPVIPDDFICDSASVSEFRIHLAEFLRLVEFNRVRVVLLRYGAPVGALVTFNDLEVLRSRAEDRILAELVSTAVEDRRRLDARVLDDSGLGGGS